MLSELMGVIADDLAVDLGTANTLVFVPGRGIVLDEPSYVAIRTGPNEKREVIAVGAEARAMVGKTPPGIELIRPMRDGVIADFVAAEAMLKTFIKRASGKMKFLRPRVIVCVPASSTPVERRAIYESALSSGARKVLLIEEPIAAALGADLKIDEPRGNMVVDIGGGTTDIAVMSLGGVLKATSVRCAGDAMDQAIVRYIRRKYHLLIAETNAERIKVEAGGAVRNGNGKAVDVVIRGRDLRRGLPTEVLLTTDDVSDAMSQPIDTISDAIQQTLDQIMPELASDIADRGICLTGGGSLLDQLDVELARRVGIPFFRADRPLLSVALGCGLVLERRGSLDRFLITPR